MDAIIKNIQKRIAEYEKKLEQHQNLMKMLQDICDHRHESGETAMQYYGHTKNFSRCAICGKEEME